MNLGRGSEEEMIGLPQCLFSLRRISLCSGSSGGGAVSTFAFFVISSCD